MSHRERVLIAGIAAAVVAVAARRPMVRPAVPGVTRLPGDTVLLAADLEATRSIVIDAPAPDVWSWVAQVGQNRGGFYSYQMLENLIGCRITNADIVVPQWQRPQVGDEVRLAPAVALSVVEVDTGRSLVLLAGSDDAGRHGGDAPGPMPYDFSWAFVVQPLGTHSRLIVRERYRYRTRWAAALVEPVSVVSAVMSGRMLRGIRYRAEALHRRHRPAHDIAA